VRATPTPYQLQRIAKAGARIRGGGPASGRARCAWSSRGEPAQGLCGSWLGHQGESRAFAYGAPITRLGYQAQP